MNINSLIAPFEEPKFEKITEDCDFYQLFRKLEKNHENCFLFESLGEERNVSRHHVVGFDPAYIIYSSNSEAIVIEDTRSGKKNSYKTKSPYYELRNYLPKKSFSRRYSGGLVGYLSYEAINYFEPHLNVKKNNQFEMFKFGVYLDGLTYDQVTGEVFYFYYEENRLEKILRYLNEDVKSYGNLETRFIGHSLSREQHREAVITVKKYINEGRVFQCEVGFRSLYKIKGDTLPIYEKLRELNPSPHMYYVKFGKQKLIGASPELLFRLRDGEMETFPLAGTTKRGDDTFEDILLARNLLNNPKEIAEHNMLVDLHRNDIGRVARCGTVKIRKLMDVKRYSHVQHISSEISGIINDNEDMFSALAANFPAGTLTGAPKLEAVKIIDELEQAGRGPYGGAVGNFSLNGDCTFAIPIRSLFLNNEDGYVQTSGGIVFDSNPDDEYSEIERKLSAMRIVLDCFNGEGI